MGNKEKIKEDAKERRKQLSSCLGAENIAKMKRQGIELNILHKSIDNLDKFKEIFNEPEIVCDYCKVDFRPNAILIHIKKTEACISHYGSKFDGNNGNEEKV